MYGISLYYMVFTPRTLKRKRSEQEGYTSEEEEGLVWSWDFQLDRPGLAELGNTEAALYTGPSREVRAFSRINVEHLHLRTAHAERNLLTQDSAIEIKLPNGPIQYGILQEIWEVNVGASVQVLIDVEVFRHSSADKNFSQGKRVSSARVPGGATRRVVFSPRDVQAQAFLSEDPIDANHLHVYKLPSSASQAASLGTEDILEF